MEVLTPPASGGWTEGAIWAAPALVVLLVLLVTGQLALVPAILAMVAVLVGGALLAGWRRRTMAALTGWVARLVTGAEASGPLPDSRLHDGLPHILLALERKVTELRRHAASSHLSQRALVEAIPDPVLVVDSRGYVRLANQAAERHFDQAVTGAMLGRLLRDPGVLAAVDSAVRADVSSSLSFSPPHARTRRYTCRISPTAVDDAEAAALISLRETSEQVAIERMRSDFIANASHELRTPLTALAGFIETLRGPARDDIDARMAFLETMASEAARMTRLIDDLLSLSKLEAEPARAQHRPVELDQVLAAATAGLGPQLERNRTPVEIQLDRGLPRVRGDADQLQQLVANLIDNASKYGKAGAPIRVTADLLDPAGDEAGPLAGRRALRISVIDQGEGIPAHHLPRLTERFYRIDKHRSRRAGGTGLGLAISKHIVRRHDGHLAIDSQIGVGSRFSVFLPA